MFLNIICIKIPDAFALVINKVNIKSDNYVLSRFLVVNQM